MRVLIASLNTYSGPYNDGKLEQLGRRVEALTAVAGDAKTIWGGENRTRSGTGYDVVVLPLRLAKGKATARLVGLKELVEAFRPTIIHIECEPWQAVAVQSVRLAKRFGLPTGVLFAEAGPRLRGIGGAMRRATGSWVLKRCDYAIGWSLASTRVAELLAPGLRTETFPATGVSPSPESELSPDRWFGAGSAALPKLAFVGRFAEEKGIHDFLEICDELARRRPLRVALAGASAGGDDTVQRWSEERTWVFLHGMLPRTEVNSMLMASDALVCPSRTMAVGGEQFGKAAAEAMVAGTPVFAYDCGALSEVIGHGGVIVPEGAQAELVDKLDLYFDASVADRVALAREARRQASGFTDDALAGSTHRPVVHV